MVRSADGPLRFRNREGFLWARPELGLRAWHCLLEFCLRSPNGKAWVKVVRHNGGKNFGWGCENSGGTASPKFSVLRISRVGLGADGKPTSRKVRERLDAGAPS